MPEDLLKYGLIPEFVGRLPIVVTLDALDERRPRKDLTEPKNALVKQFLKLFELDGVELEFQPDALAESTRKAIGPKNGSQRICEQFSEYSCSMSCKIPSEKTERCNSPCVIPVEESRSSFMSETTERKKKEETA